jgi:sugar lactone lactonase YvrE
MIVRPEIRRIGSVKNQFGEGPLWDVAEQALYWLDTVGKMLHRWTPASDEYCVWPLPATPGSLALRKEGGAVITLESGFHFFDFATAVLTPIVDPEAGEQRTAFNDGKVDRQGRFVAGSMAWDMRERLGSLYRLGRDLTLETLEREVIVSNGPCFSPEGNTLYFADSPRRAIFAYDYDLAGGPLANKRVFIDTRPLQTAPDGGTVDAEGFLWWALVLSGRIARFTPDGRLDRVIELPVSMPSSLTFGGPALKTIFVTSIGVPLAGRNASEPDAGALLAVEGLGIKGLPEPRFHR